MVCRVSLCVLYHVVHWLFATVNQLINHSLHLVYWHVDQSADCSWILLINGVQVVDPLFICFGVLIIVLLFFDKSDTLNTDLQVLSDHFL